MDNRVPGTSPLQSALSQLGATPEPAKPENVKDAFDGIARNSKIPANVLIALDEVAGGKGSVEGAQRNAAALSKAVQSGMSIQDAITQFAGDGARASAILDRSYEIADQMYPQDAAPAQPDSASDGRLSAGEVAGGLGRDVATGAVRGVGSGIRAAGVAADEIARFGDEAGKSDPTLLRTAGAYLGDAVSRFGEGIAEGRTQDYKDKRDGTQIGGSLADPSSWTLGEDPSLIGLLGVAAEGAGSMLPMVAAPGPRVAAVFGGLMAGGEGVENGRKFVEDAAKTIGDDGRPEIEKLPAYQELTGAGGMSHDDAVEEVARRAENNAGFRQGLFGSLGGAATNRIMRGADGWLGKGGRLTRAVKKSAAGAAEEGTQEAFEGAASQSGINAATGAETDILQDSFGNFVAGGLAGGGMGAVAGALGGGSDAPQEGPIDPETGEVLALPAPDAPQGGPLVSAPRLIGQDPNFSNMNRPEMVDDIGTPIADGSGDGQAAAPDGVPFPPDQGAAATGDAMGALPPPAAPAGLLPPPAGPIEAIAQGLAQNMPQPEPELPPLFPDQKPGAAVRLGNPNTGRIFDAVFIGETPDGLARVRANGVLLDLTPEEFDRSRNSATEIEAAQKAGNTGGKADVPTGSTPEDIGNPEGGSSLRPTGDAVESLSEPVEGDGGSVRQGGERGQEVHQGGLPEQHENGTGGPDDLGGVALGDRAGELANALAAGKSAGIVQHVTKKGKTKTGYVLKGVTKEQADQIDPYSFKKDGGYFVNQSRADALDDSGALNGEISTPDQVQAEIEAASGINVSQAPIPSRAPWHNASVDVRQAILDEAGPQAVSEYRRAGSWSGMSDAAKRAVIEANSRLYRAGAINNTGTIEQPNYTLSQPQKPASISQAAQDAATDPTDGQKEAGNYRKGHARWNGIEVSIENAKGSTRSGTDPSGEAWSVTMPADYGDFKGTKGADGDPVDFYNGGVENSDYVLIVDQVDAETGKFDEHKVIIGTTARGAALKIYRDGFSDGKGDARIGAITETTVDGLKAWLGGGQMRRPAAGKLDYPFKRRANIKKKSEQAAPKADGSADPLAAALTPEANRPMDDLSGLDFDAWDEKTREDGQYSPAKREGRKETGRWARAVVKALTDVEGFTKVKNAKGKEQSPVSFGFGMANELDETTIHLQGPDGIQVYVRMSSPHHRGSTQSILLQTTGNPPKPGYSREFIGGNGWLSDKMTPAEAAAEILRKVRGAQAILTRRAEAAAKKADQDGAPLKDGTTPPAKAPTVTEETPAPEREPENAPQSGARKTWASVDETTDAAPKMPEGYTLSASRRLTKPEAEAEGYKWPAVKAIVVRNPPAGTYKVEHGISETSMSEAIGIALRRAQKGAAQQEDKPTGLLGSLSQEKQDRAAELKARLAAKARGQASSGLDPEYITLGGELVALYIEAGTKRFGQMLRDFAETTGLTLREAQAPMRAAYNHVRDDMDLNGEDVSDMDDAAAVMAEVRAALAEEDGRTTTKPATTDSVKDSGGKKSPPPATGAQEGAIKSNGIKTAISVTARGREIPVQYAIVELGDLIPSQLMDGRSNPEYDQRLQPRDRSREASQDQIHRIARDLNPELLGESPQASNGAPIILPTGEVLSGNGRTLALQSASMDWPVSSRRYSDFIRDKGYPVKGISSPVLVRIVTGSPSMQEAAAIAREANERDQAEMSISEQAMADAQNLTPAILDLYQGGDVDGTRNASFVRAFAQGVLSPNDAGKMRDKDGRMTQDAVRRINAALLAVAYGDAGIVASVLESTDTNIKAIGGALMDVAPRWAQMRGEAKKGTIAADADMTPALMEAVKLIDRARRENRHLTEFLNQTDMFSGDAVSPDAVAFLGLMYRGSESKPFSRPYGRDKVADALNFFVTEAMKTSPSVDLIGESADIGAIIKSAGGRINGEGEGQQLDLDGGAENSGQGSAQSGEPGAGPENQQGETGVREQGGSSDAAQDGLTPDGDGSDRSRIASAFYERWGLGNQPSNIREARAMAMEVLGRTPSDKEIEEGIEAGIVRAARQIVDDGRMFDLANEKIFDALVSLYQAQPLLTTRTSTSVEQQAYSTPAPLAYAGSVLSGISRTTTVYEPSAGNGMLLIGADPANVTANELNDDRFGMLQEALPGAVLNHGDGTKYDPETLVDRVIANPPFGKVKDGRKSIRFPMDGVFTTEIDHAISWKALQSMKPTGRAVLIIGGHQGSAAERAKAYMGRNHHPFMTKLYDQFNVTDHFTVDGKMYQRQGAGWPVDVIVIEGKGKSALPYPYVKAPRMMVTWGEVRKVVENAKGDMDAAPALPNGDGGSAGSAGTTANQEPVSQSSGKPSGSDVRGGKSGGSGSSGSGSVRSGSAGSGSNAGNGSRGGIDGTGQSDESGRGDVPDQSGQDATGSNGRSGNGKPDAAGNGGRTLQPVKKVKRENTEEETGFQVQYSPHSNAGFAVGTLVPRAMQSAADDALSALRDEVGDIDQFVADKLGYPVARITGSDGKPGYFSAEQVDALALAIKNIEDGAAFIIGDQTGVGKGRVVAGVLLYAKKNGRFPVFVTKQPGLFADMVRDLRDIGEAGSEKRILSTKDLRGANVIPLSNEPGDVLETESAPKLKSLITGIAKTGRLPDGYDYFFTTYSQMQWEAGSAGQATYRQTAMRSLASNAVMILDESHEAGGTEQRKVDPETGEIIPTRADFFRDVLSHAHGVMYSSATYAKNPTVMSLYNKTDMRLSVDDMSKLPDAVKAGGVPLQQVIANMLVKAGQYMRRERSFAGVEMSIDQLETDKTIAKSGAKVVQGIFRLDLDYMEEARERFQDELASSGMKGAKDNSTGSSGAGSVGFSSVMHNLVAQMLFALKSDAVATRAIDLWKNGEKPLIAVSNTNESILSDFIDGSGIGYGDKADFTFKELFLRYLNRLRRVTLKDADGKSHHVYMEDDDILRLAGPDALSAVKDMEKQIAESPIGAMPGSPLDYIMDRMRDAGMKVGEITGRGTVIEGGILKSRKASDAEKKKTMNAFNSGAMDGVLLNQSGSTGFSLHATANKGNDGKQRHMIVLQPDPNIDVFMQMLGRIHRTGQIKLPKYTIAISDLAIEKRVAANLMRKMASLNANTTANKDSAVSLNNVIDFMNKYGDEVVNGILKEDSELSAKLGIGPAKGNAFDGLASKFTGRLAVLDPDEVSEIYERIEGEYKALIETLDRMGLNTLEAKTLDLEAQTISAVKLSEGDPNSSSPFEAGATMETVSAKRLGKPFTLEQLSDELAKEMGEDTEKQYVENAVRRIRDLIPAWQEKQSEGIRKAESALSDANTEAKKKAAVKILKSRRESMEQSGARLNSIIENVRKIGINRSLILRMSENGVEVQMPARSIGFDMKSLKDNPTAASAIRVRFAVADAAREVLLPLSKLIDPESPFDFTQSSAAYVDSAFENGLSDSREERSIITGNLLSGFSKFQKGQVVMFTREDGRVESGILMPKNFDLDTALAEIPVKFDKAEDAIKFLREGDGQRMVSTDDKVATIKMDSHGNFVFDVKKIGGKPYYLNKGVRDVLGEFTAGRSGKGMFTARTSSPEKAASAAKAWQDQIGATLETTSFKDEAREITGEKLPETKESRFGGNDPDMTPANSRKINAAARAELVKVGISGRVRVEVGGNGRAQGTYRRGVIRILRAGKDWKHTLDHEIIHALRDGNMWNKDYGLFTADEWRALAKAARADRNIRDRVEKTYPDLSTGQQTEEMVAEFYADWAQGRREAPQGGVTRALGRIRSFFRAVASAMRGEGFVDAAQIMERIANGEVGGRGPDGPGGAKRDAFNEWFKGSKVVDANGQPLTVFHGTRKKFDEFKVAPPKARRTADDDASKGFFFSSLREVAETYAADEFFEDRAKAALGIDKPAVEGVYLSIKNPFEFDMRGKEYNTRVYSDIMDAAKEAGHDGVHIKNVKDDGYDDTDKIGDVWVAFRPNQIKAVDNRGTFDQDSGNMREQRDMTALRGAMQSGRAKAAGLVSREFWQKSPEMFSNWLTDAMGSNSRFNILGMVPGHPLFSELGKNMSAAQSYLRNKQEMDAMRNDWQARASSAVDKWHSAGRKDPASNDALMDLMHRTTLSGIDPSKPDEWKHPHETSARATLASGTATGDAKAQAQQVMDEIQARQEAYEKLKRRYDAMPADFQKLYRDIRDEYGALADATDQALLENIETANRIALKRAERRHRQELNRIRDEGLEGDARDQAIEAADRKLAAAQKRAGAGKAARMASMRAAFEQNRLKGPYFPLARFGNYFVTVRDDDGKVISFSRFEKKAQMDAALREFENHTGRVEHGVLGAGADLRGMVDAKFVSDVIETIGEAGASDEMLDTIWQHWLETLPDQSVRKSQIHRKGRAGFNRDAIRAFSHSMFHGAHQLARLKYGLEMDENLNDAEEQAARQRNPERAGFVVREMRQRHEFTMKPTNNPLVTAGTSLAFVWYLGMSPASAMVNLSQTTIVGVPMMAARFKKAGVTGSADALWKALQDFGKGKGHIDKAPNLTADERAAIAEAYRRGTIDKTQAHDLAAVAESGVAYNPAREKAMRVIGYLFHHTERFNREVTFLASYRLLKAEGKNQQEAIEEADSLVKKIHFDYQNTARPRVMQGDAAKLLLVFRNFTVNMLYRLFRDTHQAFNGESTAAQKEARDQLVGVTLSMMAHAGIKGVWGYGLIMGLLGMFYPGGDGDDLEEWLQDALLMEGDTPATAAWNWTMGMALNGVPGNVLGVSLTNRIGMPNLWFQPPRAGTEGRDVWTHYLEQIAGPVAAIPGSFLSGMSMISDAWGEGNSDNMMRGIERATPGFIGDIVKPVRMMTHGANTYYGDPLIENVSVLDAFRSALGFTPAKLAERYDINNRLKAKEKEITSRRARIHKAIGDAMSSGEDIPDRVMKDLQKFNSEYPEYPITPETARASMRSRARMKERNEFGVSLNPKLNDRIRSETAPAIYG